MVAAIQAAKNQLEVDKSKRPPSSSQPNNSPLHHQRSKSFTNTTTNTNNIQSNNSPLPPTNIVSFNPKSSNNNNTNNTNNNNQPIPLNRSVSDTAAAAHPYHNNNNNNNRGHHELDYIHPDYQYSDNADNDNDTITSSLSGTLPEYNSSSSYMRRSSSHSGLGIGSGVIQATAAATIQPALTKDHLKHLPAQSVHNIDAAFSSKMNLLPPLNNNTNSTNSNANSTVDGQIINNAINNAAQQQQVNTNNANNNNNASKQFEKESPNNNTKGRTVEEIMSAYQGKVDTILNKRDHGGSSSTSVGSRGSNNNNSSSTSLGAALATLNTSTSSQQQQYLSSSKSVGNNNNKRENRTTFNASKSVGNPTTSISSGVVDLSISSSGGSRTGSGESKIDDILSTYKQKVGEIMAKSNNTSNNNNNNPTPYHHNLDDSDRGYNTDDNGGTTTRSVISRQPSLAVDNVILDDEESIGSNREAALDYDNRRDSGAGSYKSCNSGSEQEGSQGSGSYHSREEDSRERSDMLMTSEATTLDNDMMAFNNNNVISNKVKDHLGSMSERANAILQSINNNSNSKNSNLSANPENDDNDNDDNRNSENRTRSNSEASTQSNGGEEEGSYDNDSYISGASSASELSSQIEGAAYGYHDTNRPLPQSQQHEPEAQQLDTSPLRRKDTHDSLQRAQAAISLPIKSSSSTAQQQQTNTTGDTTDATSSDRKYRQDLEKKVRSEATQREMEYTQLETKLKEAQSQLDTLQAQARTTKYSSSEQASRIKDLERKLKNEKDNNAELKRERDAMKDEYDQDLEEQKDINRQLEQMVMSEEFEKELEDEINQVKELEHANRRFKVKIDSKCMGYVCFGFVHILCSLFERYPFLQPTQPGTTPFPYPIIMNSA